MIKKEINHPFRTIHLEYDELKEETQFEKDLIKEYTALHDVADETKKECYRLVYFYEEHDAEITRVEKELQPVAEAVSDFARQLQNFAASPLQPMEEVRRLQGIMMKCYDLVPGFHEQVSSLAAQSEGLEAQCEKYYDVEDNMQRGIMKFRRETTIDMYKNHESYSLDVNAFHDEDRQFSRQANEIPVIMREAREVAVQHYNRLMKAIGDLYQQLEASKKLLTDFYDDQHLLDDSISERCKAQYDAATCPIYLMEPGDKRIETYRNTMGIWANSGNKVFDFKVAVDVVKLGQVMMMQEFLMVLQHFPKLIEKSIFSINISFVDDLGIAMKPEQWKGVPEPMRWFAKMSSLPCVIFFLADHDARAYALMGDLVADGKLKGEGEGSQQMVRIEGEVLHTIANRLFNSCWFFMLYCHNTGFNPESYIQAIIADFDLPFTYEDVVKKYNEDIKVGIKLRTVEVPKNTE